jgi:hypothetical protein
VIAQATSNGPNRPAARNWATRPRGHILVLPTWRPQVFPIVGTGMMRNVASWRIWIVEYSGAAENTAHW